MLKRNDQGWVDDGVCGTYLRNALRLRSGRRSDQRQFGSIDTGVVAPIWTNKIELATPIVFQHSFLVSAWRRAERSRSPYFPWASGVIRVIPTKTLRP